MTPGMASYFKQLINPLDKTQSAKSTGIIAKHIGSIAQSTLGEIKSAIECQKMNKALCIDDIPAELLKSGGSWTMIATLNLIISI